MKGLMIRLSRADACVLCLGDIRGGSVDVLFKSGKIGRIPAYDLYLSDDDEHLPPIFVKARRMLGLDQPHFLKATGTGLSPHDDD